MPTARFAVPTWLVLAVFLVAPIVSPRPRLTTSVLVRLVRRLLQKTGNDVIIPSMTNKKTKGLFVVRLYDGFDNIWMDVSKPVTKAEADKIWAEKTGNGTHHSKYADIDYYRVFPADTVMLYSDDSNDS